LTLPETRAALDRSIGLPQAAAMVVGIILGASIFVQPAEVSRHVPSIPATLLVWLACGLLTLCGVLVCAELAAALPQTGGVYVFLRDTLSPSVGFLWGWAMFWSVHSGIIAAMAVIFARYVAYFFPMGDGGIRGVAIAGILVLSAINYAGVRQGSTVQTFLTFAKLAAVVLLLALFFFLGRHSAVPTANPPASVLRFPLREYVLALSAGLFTYGGWHMVTYAAGETRQPERTIPRALLLGTLTVTACYLALNAAYLYVLPLERVVASTRVAADAASALAGPRGAAAISVLVSLSAFGALNGTILAGPRVYFAMAEDGLAFRWMGRIHARYKTPGLSIVAQAIWSSALVAMGTYRSLFTRVIYTEWVFFALMAIGLLRWRRKAGTTPRMLAGGPLLPVLFIAACALILYTQIATDPKESAKGLLLVAAGFPVYLLWKRAKSSPGAIPNASD
jgi:APA family basic amino acid/polyamine antiporter